MLPLFKRSFSTVTLSYSYGAVVNSSGITDFIDATLAHEDFWTFGLTEFLKKELSATRITLLAFA